MQLPLTLAIIEGLEVVLGDERFIIPLAVVRECVELAGRPGRRRRVLAVIDLRGELVPYLRLREWFGVPGSPPAIEQIVVTETDGLRVGIAWTSSIGEHQTVIKPLGRLFRTCAASRARRSSATGASRSSSTWSNSSPA